MAIERKIAPFAVGGAGMIVLMLAARNVQLPLVKKTFGIAGRAFANGKVQLALGTGVLINEGNRWRLFYFNPHMRAFRMLAPLLTNPKKWGKANLAALAPLLAKEIAQIEKDKVGLKPRELLAHYRRSALKRLEEWSSKLETRYARLRNRCDALPESGLKTYLDLAKHLQSIWEVQQIEAEVGPIPWEAGDLTDFKARLDASSVSPTLLFRVLSTRGEAYVAQFVQKLNGCAFLDQIEAAHVAASKKCIADLECSYLLPSLRQKDGKRIRLCNNPLQAFIQPEDELLAMPTGRHPQGFYVEYERVTPVATQKQLQPLFQTMVEKGLPYELGETWSLDKWSNAVVIQTGNPRLCCAKLAWKEIDLPTTYTEGFLFEVHSRRAAIHQARDYLHENYEADPIDEKRLAEIVTTKQNDVVEAVMAYGNAKKPDLRGSGQGSPKEKLFAEILGDHPNKSALVFSEKDQKELQGRRQPKQSSTTNSLYSDIKDTVVNGGKSLIDTAICRQS